MLVRLYLLLSLRLCLWGLWLRTNDDNGGTCWKRTNCGNNLLQCSTPIVVGERDLCTMLVTNAEGVIANKGFAERLVSQDVTALVKQSIDRVRS